MRKQHLAAGIVAAVTAALLSSCAMAYDDPNYMSKDRAEAGALAADPVGNGEQEEQVSAATANPTSLGIDTPLSTKPASGKTIINLSNQTQLGPIQDAAMVDAATVLGWTVESEPLGTTVESQAAAIAKAVQAKPDGIAVSWIDSVALADALAAAESAGIPVVCTGCAGEPEGAIKDTSIAGTEQELAWGRMMAAFVADNSENDAAIQWLTLPMVPALITFMDGFQQGLTEVCPPCYSSSADQAYVSPPLADATGIIDVISLMTLQTFMGAVSGDLFDHISDPEVATALDDALLDPAPLAIGNLATRSNIEGLSKGEQSAWTAFSAPVAGWRVIDSFARIFGGDELPAVPLPTQLLTQENVADAALDAEGNYVGIADYQEQFTKLWLAE